MLLNASNNSLFISDICFNFVLLVSIWIKLLNSKLALHLGTIKMNNDLISNWCVIKKDYHFCDFCNFRSRTFFISILIFNNDFIGKSFLINSSIAEDQQSHANFDLLMLSDTSTENAVRKHYRQKQIQHKNFLFLSHVFNLYQDEKCEKNK